MQTQPNTESPVTWTRTLVAFSSIAIGLLYLVLDSGLPDWPRDAESLLVSGFMVAVIASPFVLRLPSMAAQIFGRAVLLQAALFSSMALINATLIHSRSYETVFEISLVLAAVIWPLVVIGKRGLSTSSRHFRPDAFRATLIASLLFGLADAWALVFYSAVTREVGAMLVCAGVMAVALFGLFRMKVWGLALCVVANVVIAALALSSAFDLPEVLSWGLVATAGVQLLLPIPLMNAVRKGAATRRPQLR